MGPLCDIIEDTEDPDCYDEEEAPTGGPSENNNNSVTDADAYVDSTRRKI